MAKEKLDSESILKAVRDAAEETGHTPTYNEFRSLTGITLHRLLQNFSSWSECVVAAGLKPRRVGPYPPDVLLKDWGEFVRRKGHVPTREEYNREGTYNARVFANNFGGWSGVPLKFRQYAEGKGEWEDVVQLLLDSDAMKGVPKWSPYYTTQESREITTLELPHERLADRPVCGKPIDFRGVRHEPVNELGVLLFFGLVARDLNYQIESVQAAFPDCLAIRKLSSGEWQQVRIEFEFDSRNFSDHKHPPEECDVIVCWRHNWPKCPLSLEVIELRKVVYTLMGKGEE